MWDYSQVIHDEGCELVIFPPTFCAKQRKVWQETLYCILIRLNVDSFLIGFDYVLYCHATLSPWHLVSSPLSSIGRCHLGDANLYDFAYDSGTISRTISCPWYLLCNPFFKKQHGGCTRLIFTCILYTNSVAWDGIHQYFYNFSIFFLSFF
jgi:hypothetical protein